MREPRGRWRVALLAVLALGACVAESDPDVAEREASAEGAIADPAAEGEMAMAEGDLACQPMTGEMELEGRLSPYDSTSIEVGGREALLCYGRPSARGRTMVGGESVPYGQLWRTGANEPTTLHLPFAADVAGIPVEPGTYTLYTIPGESEWTVIVNASTTQWGHESTYTPEVEAQEVGRASVPARPTASFVETLTFTSQRAGEDAATLILEWENTRVEIPIRATG